MSQSPAALALEIASWVEALRWEHLPDRLRERAQLWLLDSLGLMVAAYGEAPGTAVRRVAIAQGGVPEARLVVSGKRLPVALTALVHGTLAHTFDYDDTFPDSVVHPGSIVVPAALGGVEARDANVADLVTAVVAGYEVAARLGAAAGRRFHARGFQASGVIGPVVAAAVSAKAARLDAPTMAAAMGSAGSMGGGLLEFLHDGTWTKRLHPGWAGHAGVLAARFAAEGFTGPASVLEGRYGLYEAFLNIRPDPDVVVGGLGQRFESEHAEFKFYPCAHAIHPFLEAATALSQAGLEAGRIVRIELTVAPWYVPIVCEPVDEKLAPVTEYQARTSLPFAVAAALFDGAVGLDTFDKDALAREDIRALAQRVDVKSDPALEGGFSGTLIVHTDDGRSHAPPEGDGVQPVEERVVEKFSALTRDRPQAAAVRELLGDHDGPASRILDALSDERSRPPGRAAVPHGQH